MDGLLQPRIGALYHGVSRQAPLLRSPSQMQELDNFLPSVDIGGIVDRAGSSLIQAVGAGPYAPGTHHFFRTSDGQRWVILRRVESGSFEIRNLSTGAPASLVYGPYTQAYIGGSTALKYLTISDTTLILNPGVIVQTAAPAKPALTTCYVYIKRLSTAAQSFVVQSSQGAGFFQLQANQGNIITRSFAALQLMNSIASNMPGVAVSMPANSLIKLTASEAVIASVVASNDWDAGAVLLIKDRVSAAADLPPSYEPNVPVLVDEGSGDSKAAYYVRYDPSKNAWVETSYLPNAQTTGTLYGANLPIKLRQLGPNSFDLQVCDWVPRKVGDNDSNPLPEFAGRPITAIAQWKGRLWLASGDTVYASQPDDLFNFFRESAREVRPADPVTLPADTPDVATIQHLVAFRNKLMVITDTAQLEIPGDKAITPTDAVIGVATRYQLNEGCEPKVIGDSLYFSGPAEGHSALWEYAYDQNMANNVAEDLCKHIPSYIPGRVTKIRGSSQAGRHFCWSSSDPGRLYVHTGYFKDTQRAQNAWSRLTFAKVTNILDFWVYEATLYVLATDGATLWMISQPVEVDLGTILRLELQKVVTITWSSVRNRSEFDLPDGLAFPGILLCVNQGDGWPREYPVTPVWNGQKWIAHFPQQLTQTTGVVGVRFARSATFSPFYPVVDGDKPTPLGRLQIRNVQLDALVSADFTATITRPDRVQQAYARSPRVIGDVLVPTLGYNVQHRIPFNSRGDAATLTFSTTSTGPTALTGYTLMGRYTNPFTQ